MQNTLDDMAENVCEALEIGDGALSDGRETGEQPSLRSICGRLAEWLWGRHVRGAVAVAKQEACLAWERQVTLGAVGPGRCCPSRHRHTLGPDKGR